MSLVAPLLWPLQLVKEDDGAARDRGRHGDLGAAFTARRQVEITDAPQRQSMRLEACGLLTEVETESALRERVEGNMRRCARRPEERGTCRGGRGRAGQVREETCIM